ncbi:MAG TPA: molybdopterin-dependent oxidoreductase, partial [Mycobacteriales bacterium]|nr:molybdopterin-dependent oxidoreductase [Mycobacteriales bacterium]
ALAGVVAAGVALGVAELVAVAFGPRTSPIIAVGQGVIRLTPEPVKEFAIETFGEADKIALLVGTGVLLVLFAVVVGLVAVRRLAAGLAGVALLGGVGAFAAVVDPTGSLVSALPSLVGGLLGAVALVAMVRPLQGRSPLPSSSAPPADGPAPGRAPLAGVDRGGAGTDRRTFLISTGAAAGVAVATGAAGRTLLSRRFDVAAARADVVLPPPAVPAPPLPAGVSLEVPGITPWLTPDAEFYRVDTALVLPQVDPDSWSLRITGRVGRERTYTYEELLERDLVERHITLTCVSNEVGGGLAGNGRWLGVPLAELLEEAEVEDGATQLVSRSVDGMTIGTPTRVARETDGAMIALALNGEPLSVERGFPARMIVPGLYGYVSACKWITEIEATTFDDFDVYWVRRDWAQEAPIKTASRIDTPRPFARLQAGQPVAVAGVAWAQTRGISKVEVRIGDGPWEEARLAAAANEDTWRQWVYEWTPDAPGRADIVVRATDGDGVLQTEERVPIFPDGSSGWHTTVVQVA